MDFIDERRGKYTNLENINLAVAESEIVRRLSAGLENKTILFRQINRGLSNEIKLIAKPQSLFPFFIKVGDHSEIQKEYEGYKLLRLRVPSTNIPHFEKIEYYKDKAGIMYRYVTAGLVSDKISRLDLFIGEDSQIYSEALIKELFDVVMKKCHWFDGQAPLKKIKLPPLESPQQGYDQKIWDELVEYYESIKVRAEECKAPHAIIHGDLHPKNVLVTKNYVPIIIDFTMADEDSCVYRDYAKLEIHLQFQVMESVAKQFLHIAQRTYTSGELILPRSNREISSCIHALRCTLWKTCLSKTFGLTNQVIDTGYTGYLMYYLIRFWSKTGNSFEARELALSEIRSLAHAI